MNTTDMTKMNICTSAGKNPLSSAGKKFLAFAAMTLVAAFGLAGRAYADGDPTLSVTNDFADQTITVTATNISGGTLYYIVDESNTAPDFVLPSNNSTDDEEGSSWQSAPTTGVVDVSSVSDGYYVHLYYYVDDNTHAACSTQVVRYTAPTIEKVASQLQFTVALPAAGVGVVVGTGILWSKASSTEAPAALSLTDGAYTYSNSDALTTNDFEYYTTYSFRATGTSHFPSDVVTISTRRYHRPAVANYTPFSSLTGITTPASGHLQSNSPKIYLNYSKYVDPDATQMTLKTPVPGNDNTYDIAPPEGSSFSLQNGTFVLVAAADPSTDDATADFPSEPVTVDSLYTDCVVLHTRTSDGVNHFLHLGIPRGETAYKAIDGNQFDYSCLWRRDARTNKISHTQNGTTYYLQMDGGGNIIVTTNADYATVWANDGNYMMREDNRNLCVAFTGSSWHRTERTEGTTPGADVHYVAKRRYSRAGNTKEVSTCQVNHIFAAGATSAETTQPLWMALKQGASQIFSATPFIVLTSFQLPPHYHYSINCRSGEVHDFTYFNATSYESHALIAGNPSQEIIRYANDPGVDFEWNLSPENAPFSLQTSGEHHENVTVTRTGAVTGPVECTLTVTVHYHRDATASGDLAINVSAVSRPLTLIAEQTQTALTPVPNSHESASASTFRDGNYYLLRNYHTPSGTVAYLSAHQTTDGGNAVITTGETYERLFIVRSHEVDNHTYYSFEDPALDAEVSGHDHLFLTWGGQTDYCLEHPNAVFSDDAGTGDNIDPLPTQLFDLVPCSDGTPHSYTDNGETVTYYTSYFTLRPKNAPANSSLVPDAAEIDDGNVLRNITSDNSHYTFVTSHDVPGVPAESTKEYYYASRWELVDPALLHPEVEMTPEGVVTLHDRAGELRQVEGTVYWQTRASSTDNWGDASSIVVTADHSHTLTDTYAEGNQIQTWKTAEGTTHSYFDPSSQYVFTVEKVAAPVVTFVGNQVVITAEGAERIYYTTTDSVDADNPRTWTRVEGTSVTFPMHRANPTKVYAFAVATNKLKSDVTYQSELPKLTILADTRSSAPSGSTQGIVKLKVAVIRTDNGVEETTYPTSGWEIKYTTDNNDPLAEIVNGHDYHSNIYDTAAGIRYTGFVNIKAYAVPTGETPAYRQSEMYSHLYNGNNFSFCFLTPDANKPRHEQTNNFLLINLNNGNIFNSTSLSTYNRRTDDENVRNTKYSSETYLWQGTNQPNTATPIINTVTGASLALDIENGVPDLHVAEAADPQMWQWSGEWTPEGGVWTEDMTRTPCPNCYRLKTTVDGIDYYLAFNTATSTWTAVTDPAATGYETQVAFRTFTVDYQGGFEFKPEKDSLYIKLPDAPNYEAVAGKGEQAWAALATGEEMHLHVGLSGVAINYEKNQDINIVRPEFSSGTIVNGVLNEHDDATFVCWQQWHRYTILEDYPQPNKGQVGDTAFTQYFTGVSGYRSVPTTNHPVDNYTHITWKYNGNILHDGTDLPLGTGTNVLFTYTFDANHPDYITVKRTNNNPDGGHPDFSTQLHVDVSYDNAYASGGQVYTNTDAHLYLFAEQRSDNNVFSSSSNERTRFKSQATDRYLSLLPNVLVTGEDDNYGYLNNQPKVGTDDDYTQYSAWMVRGTGNSGTRPFTIRPIQWQDRQICHRPGNTYEHGKATPNGLYLYEEGSVEDQNYRRQHPEGPFALGNDDYLKFDIHLFGAPANGTTPANEYVVISPYLVDHSTGQFVNDADHLGISNATDNNQWVNAFYGAEKTTQTVNGVTTSLTEEQIFAACTTDFWRPRWKEEHAWLTPPAIDMTPDGVVTIRHRLEGAPFTVSGHESDLQYLHYYYTTDDSDPSFSGTVADGGGLAPSTNFAHNDNTHLYDPANKPTLTEGQTIKVVAVLTNSIETEHFHYNAHISKVQSLTAVKCAAPVLNTSGESIVSTSGDSLVAGLVTSNMGDPQWNSNASDGYIHYGSEVTLHTLGYRSGHMVEARAYLHNKLQSDVFYHFEQTDLTLSIFSADATSGEVKLKVGAAGNDPVARASYYELYYTTNGDDPSDINCTTRTVIPVMADPDLDYNHMKTLTLSNTPVTFKAVALPKSPYTHYRPSPVVSRTLIPSSYTGATLTGVNGTTNAGESTNPYRISTPEELWTVAKKVNDGTLTTSNKFFKVTADIDMEGITLPSIGNSDYRKFQGYFDGGYHVISHLTNALFEFCLNAYVYNVVIDRSQIERNESAKATAGIVCDAANSQIFNCGVRSSDKENPTTITNKSTNRQAGSIAGYISGTTHVVNCYSFATVVVHSTATDRPAAGIVGRMNDKADRTNKNNVTFNCVNYGHVETTNAKTKIDPVVDMGTSNVEDNFFPYNFYNAEAGYDLNKMQNDGSFGVEASFLNRFEQVRYIMNSNRNRCGWWVNGSNFNDKVVVGSVGNSVTVPIGTWVLDTTIAEFPILKPKYQPNNTTVINYPSIINPNYEASWRDTETRDYHGKKLTNMGTNGKLTVTVLKGAKGGSLTNPADQEITITDMDTNVYDFNYGKIQLPYFQDLYGRGTNIQNDGSSDWIVTGWKITSVTKGETTYTSSSVTNYNYADRSNPQKDIYDANNNIRVFAQGGFYNVPDGVTAITIEAYWGKAYYLKENNNDVYWSTTATIEGAGQVDNTMYGSASATAFGLLKSKTYSNPSSAITAMKDDGAGSTVYDRAIVLLTDCHIYGTKDNVSGFYNKDHTYPFTVTTLDEDMDHEPDHVLYHYFIKRALFNPIRFDFLTEADYSMMGKFDKNAYHLGLTCPKGHYEITETSMAHFYQFEYDYSSTVAGKVSAPLILNGGIFETFCSAQNGNGSDVASNVDTTSAGLIDETQYIHLGGHVYFKYFAQGANPNNNKPRPTKRCPVTVTGGEYKLFHLSGYLFSVQNPWKGSAYLYASGGRFRSYASGGMEEIKGNIVVKANHIVADEFYAGGINPDETFKHKGSIDVTLDYSWVKGTFAAGPKFGVMNDGTTVTASATGSRFGEYYGAGYGGTGKVRIGKDDIQTSKSNLIDEYKNYINDKYKPGIRVDGNVDIDYDFEFIPWSNSTQHCKRFYVIRGKLSKATVNNAESTLKDCIIDGDYYGGGFVGQVKGLAKSTLEDCTVKGNIFAGGNSSKVPTARIYDWLPNNASNDKDKDYWPQFVGSVYINVDKNNNNIDPTLKPTYNDYTWVTGSDWTGASIPSQNGNKYIDEDNLVIYTTESLDDLGQCQSTNLTVKGNTIVGTPGDERTGSIYGGGNEAAMAVLVNGQTCSTSVKVEGNTRVYRDVFGAGKHGVVQGGTNVFIGESGESGVNHRPLVLGDIYGGGDLADVQGNTSVTMYDGVTGPIYGGGNEGSVRSTGTGNNIERHSTTIDILGGHVGYRPNYPAYQAPDPNVEGDEGTEGTPFAEVASIDIDRGFDIIGDLVLSDNNLKPDIKTVGRPKMYYGVFGGGYGYGTVVSGGSTVNIGGNTMNADVKIYGSVYGGGEAGQVGGGFRSVWPATDEDISAKGYYKYDPSSNTIVENTDNLAVATDKDDHQGVKYLKWDAPSWTDAATVNVIPDASKAKTIDIAGAVFGGGRGYFITTVEKEDLDHVQGTENDPTQPHAGAIYGTTAVTIGADQGDTAHLHIGSFNYFTDHEKGLEYNLVNEEGLTSQAVFWQQNLWVFDKDLQRHIPLTVGQNIDIHTVAANTVSGWKEIDVSENNYDEEVKYYLATGRVSVAGGGERGAVYGSTAFAEADGLRSTVTDRYAANMAGGNTTVTIHSGTVGDFEDKEVNGCVYGAGLSATIDGTSSVTIDGVNAWVRGDAYAGGCMGQVYAFKRNNANADVWATTQTLTKGWVRNAHGGSNLTNHGKGCKSKLIVGSIGGNNDQLLVSESVYGGNGFSPSDGEAEVTVLSGRIGYVRAGYDINGVDDEGNHDAMEGEKNTIVENNQDALAYEGNVYGGGFGPEARINKTTVTVSGGIIRNGVFGGGELAPVMQLAGTEGENPSYHYRTVDANGHTDDVATRYIAVNAPLTTVTVSGGQMGMVLGGGRGYSDFVTTTNVYPGTVMGNTLVTLSGTAQVRPTPSITSDLGGGNVYGGGLEGEVTGSTTVTMTAGTVQGNVFGGGRGYRAAMMGDNATTDDYIYNHASRDAGAVWGNTSVSVSGGTIGGDDDGGGIYGGGEGLNFVANLGGTRYEDQVATVHGNATVAISGGTVGGGYTYGASEGHASYAGGRVASVRGYADITISGNANVAAVYGGNDISGKVMDSTARTARTGNDISGNALDNTTETYVKVVGKPRIGRLFGGGNGKYDYYNNYSLSYLNLKRPVQMATYVDIKMDDMANDEAADSTAQGYQSRYIGAAYAGGNQAAVGGANAPGMAQLMLQGPGLVDSLYGGGNNATVWGSATVTVNAASRSYYCNVNQLFGGNNQATMGIVPDINLVSGYFGRVFGGGNAGSMTGLEDRTDRRDSTLRGLSTYILVDSRTVTVREGLYGGCNHARVTGGTFVDVRQTSTQPEVDEGDPEPSPRDYGIYQLFGGNDISAYVRNARLDVSGGVVHNIFGGGNGNYDYVRNNDRWNAYVKGHPNDPAYNVANYVPKEPYVLNTQVNIWGGDIRSAIYGGGYAGDCGTTHVVIDDAVTFPTENANNNENQNDNPLLPSNTQGTTTTTELTIAGEIYGGGLGDASMIYRNAPASEHVGNVEGTAYVDLYNVTNLSGTKVYGGGKSGNVKNTLVTVHPTWIKELAQLYGGCWGGDVTGTARVVMNCAALEGEGLYNVDYLYGGNDYSGNVYKSVLTVNGGRYRSVYGGGNGDYGPDATLKYTPDYPNVSVPNSEYPVVNFNHGIVTENLYGGGNLGTCKVVDATGRTGLDKYAFVQVNVHGGEFMNNIFAGASGKAAAQNTPPLVVGLKELNMDNGLVHQSVYGGTESVDDGYKTEYSVDGNTVTSTIKLRPSSVMNLVGGTVKNNVYGGGYLGNAYGSVYVNVGKEAVLRSRIYERTYGTGTNPDSYNMEGLYKPAFTTDETADTGATLMPRNLYLERSIYNGANWGDASSSYIFNTRGFFDGESRIRIDGLGYNTTGSREGNSDPAMDIRYSLIGAGTSCEGGDVHRHIHLLNYGHWEGCDVSKTLWSIQRCDSVMFENVGLALTGDQDAYTAYASTRYAMNRCDTILFKGENVLRLDQPVVNSKCMVFRDANGALVDDVTEAADGTLTLAPSAGKLTAMKNVLGAASFCNDDCAKVQAVVGDGYTSLLVNNGAYVDIFYTNNEGNLSYGSVLGYGFLRAEDQTQAIVSARYKTIGDGGVHTTDGGFFSLCPDDNIIATQTDPEQSGYDGNVHHGTDGGRKTTGNQIISEFNYGNYGTSGDTYRAWKMGQGKRLRHITITAHQDLTQLPEQNKWALDAFSYTDNNNQTVSVNLAVAKATLELPPTENGHYYKIAGGIKVDQENRELNLIPGALLPGTYTNQTTGNVYASSNGNGAYANTQVLTNKTWLAHNGGDVSDANKKMLADDPSHNFGLLITAGAPLDGTGSGNNTAAIYSNTYFTGTNGYQTKPVTGSSNVMPTIDVYLTYNPAFTTTLLGDVEFTLHEYDASGNEVGTVDVLISISTVIKEMKPQEIELLAMHNEFGINTYSRKLVLPASLVRRNLYLTSIKWEPTEKGTEEYTDNQSRHHNGNFFLRDTNDLPADTATFALRVMPTEDISASLTTTLGWSEIGENSVVDLFKTVKRLKGITADRQAYSKKTGDTPNQGFDTVSLKNNTNDNKGLFMGVLDGRSSAGIDLTLFFNSDLVYTTGRKGKATLHFEYYDQNNATSIGTIGSVSGAFDLIIYVKTRDKGDTIYMASADELTRGNITLKHWSEATHNCPSCGYTYQFRGREPIQYFQTFTEAMSIYEAGDVICILDTVIITGDENDVIHGTEYNFVPVVRYSGNHSQFPGKQRAYRGTMISLREQGQLTTDHMIFDGSMVSKWKQTVTEPFTDDVNRGTRVDIPYRYNPDTRYDDIGTISDSAYAYADWGWVKDTLRANGPIFEIRDGGVLTLGHKTTVQNNYNGATTTQGVLGGAVRIAKYPRPTVNFTPDAARPDEQDTASWGWYKVHTSWTDASGTHNEVSPRFIAPNPTLTLNNTVEIKNILTDATATGAIHMEDGTFTLGTAKEGTAISVKDNYHKNNDNYYVATSNGDRYVVNTSEVEDWPTANVYLARTATTTDTTYPDSALNDSKSCIITFGNELSAKTRIGISKVFPGKAFTIPAPSGSKTDDQHFAAVRDTIQVAEVTGTHQQYMLSAYENRNFFNDGRLYGADHATVDTFYHPALSTSTLYLQRCATFQKQVYAANGDYDELPVLQYRMNTHAACPNGTDTAVFSVHGGCYPYTYTWTLGTDNTIRTYTTPYQHDKVKADNAATNTEHLKAKASNSDSALLAGMLLNSQGQGGSFTYTVTATDNFGCKLKKSFRVDMSRVTNWNDDPNAGTVDQPLVLTAPVDANDAVHKYDWADTTDDVEVATRKYKAVHFFAKALQDPNWGSISRNLGSEEGTEVTDATPLCPGDAIYLNATSDDYNFIQWDFDPYDIPKTVFVMPNSGGDITVHAYFGPKTYWKDVVKTQPEGFVTDYNGDVHISDANELAWLISLANGLNGVQARTFFYNKVYLTPGTYDMKDHLWTPIGSSQHPFMGQFLPEPGSTGDVIIQGIIVNEPRMPYVGLFGYLDSATVQDITLQKSHFVGQQYVGALAGEARNSTLTNITIADTGAVENQADVTTLITANYASGGMVGTATKTNITDNSVKARYMGATIYNGGVVGYGEDVTIANNGIWSWPRMSSLYSSGLMGNSTGTTSPTSGSKSRGGSQIVNNYVRYENPDGKATRAGGLVGRARNTYIANNYVYGVNTGATLSGAIGSLIESGVHVENCFFEQGFDNQAFGYNSSMDTTGVTSFHGSGTEVILTDTLGNNSNLARQLNRWVYAHGDTTLIYWHSDTANVNNGYPVFGEPEYQEYTATREVATCDGLLVAGQNYTTSGTYYYHAVDSAEFTDTTVTLYLTINYSELTEFTDSVRRGEGYEGHGFYLTPKEIGLMMQTLQEEGSVTVVVSDTLQTLAGCDSIVTLYLTVGSALTTPNSQLMTLKVYPNPTTKLVTVEADGLQQVELYDAVSRKLQSTDTFTHWLHKVADHSSHTNTLTLDLDGLPAGAYYLRIRTDNGTVIKKVIKR